MLFSLSKVSSDQWSLHNNMPIAGLLLTTITKGGLFLILQDVWESATGFFSSFESTKSRLYVNRFCRPLPPYFMISPYIVEVVQYSGGYNQYSEDNISTVWDSFSTVEDSFSTVEGIQYIGGTFSTVGDNFSIVGNTLNTVEGVQYSGG